MFHAHHESCACAGPAEQYSDTSRKRKHTIYDPVRDNTHKVEIPLKRPRTIENNTQSSKLPFAKASGIHHEAPADSPEKRLRRFRPKPPRSYLEIKERALSQRLTVLSRQRLGTLDLPEEKVTIAGSTGNLYTVHVGLVPSCDCPHARKGNQCKHIVYIMHRVLKAPEHVTYQLALTSVELRTLFATAPPIPSSSPAPSSPNPTSASSPPPPPLDSNRKPITGDCPICYTPLLPSPSSISYCRALCGHNIHTSCMQSWARASRSANPTCPLCRAPWDMQDPTAAASGKIDLKAAMTTTMTTQEGYVNVAAQLGLSGRRDWSSYHQPWVRRRFRGW